MQSLQKQCPHGSFTESVQSDKQILHSSASWIGCLVGTSPVEKNWLRVCIVGARLGVITDDEGELTNVAEVVGYLSCNAGRQQTPYF